MNLNLNKLDPEDMHTQIFRFPDQLKDALDIGMNHRVLKNGLKPMEMLNYSIFIIQFVRNYYFITS